MIYVVHSFTPSGFDMLPLCDQVVVLFRNTEIRSLNMRSKKTLKVRSNINTSIQKIILNFGCVLLRDKNIERINLFSNEILALKRLEMEAACIGDIDPTAWFVYAQGLYPLYFDMFKNGKCGNSLQEYYQTPIIHQPFRFGGRIPQLLNRSAEGDMVVLDIGGRISCYSLKERKYTVSFVAPDYMVAEMVSEDLLMMRVNKSSCQFYSIKEQRIVAMLRHESCEENVIFPFLPRSDVVFFEDIHQRQLSLYQMERGDGGFELIAQIPLPQSEGKEESKMRVNRGGTKLIGLRRENDFSLHWDEVRELLPKSVLDLTQFERCSITRFNRSFTNGKIKWWMESAKVFKVVDFMPKQWFVLNGEGKGVLVRRIRLRTGIEDEECVFYNDCKKICNVTKKMVLLTLFNKLNSQAWTCWICIRWFENYCQTRQLHIHLRISLHNVELNGT
eukprot:TRINITY_DN6493_c0_g2_i2.p1 TRINITY_DN6493_c0_g2~~TRINITY_DN6493_c0_g2_i2.p1  ORF type:complete len:445 (+),score=4.99 TRINITY_DN6493_c0_g2_i2:2-1336(+)